MSALPIEPESLALAQLWLGGMLMPGIIEPGGIVGWERVTKLTEKPAKGSDGASITVDGDENPKGTITLSMWDPEQLVAWAEAYAVLRAAREAGTALDIVNPVVNAIEVSSVIIEKIPSPVYEAGGKWRVALGMRQWLPAPKPAPKSPSGSAGAKNGANSGNPEGDGTPGNAEAEQTAAEKEFAALAEEAMKP